MHDLDAAIPEIADKTLQPDVDDLDLFSQQTPAWCPLLFRDQSKPPSISVASTLVRKFLLCQTSSPMRLMKLPLTRDADGSGRHARTLYVAVAPIRQIF